MEIKEACVVLYGPPMAGKRTLMDQIGRLSSAAPLVVREPAIECGENPDIGSSLAFTAGTRRVKALTFSGGVWNEEGWSPLIYAAAAVILVLDAQETRRDADLEFVRKLAIRPRQSPLGCVALTKQDLGRGDTAILSGHDLLAGSPFASWPVFLTRSGDTSEISRLLAWLTEALGR
jgi:hypothetical protein